MLRKWFRFLKCNAGIAINRLVGLIGARWMLMDEGPTGVDTYYWAQICIQE